MIGYTNPYLSEFMAALAWRVDLERWYDLDKEARIVMMAVYQASKMMESAEAAESARKHDR